MLSAIQIQIIPIVKCVLSWLYRAPKEMIDQNRIILFLVGLLVISAGLVVIDFVYVKNSVLLRVIKRKIFVNLFNTNFEETYSEDSACLI